MRKPNGYGCIKRLSGNRRRPFVFVISDAGRQRPVEYFATQVEAEIFAADYNKVHNRTSLADHRLTFSELYYRWLSRHIADTDPSASAICGYKNAFRHCSVLHGMPYAEIKYSDYQRIIDDMRKAGLSYSSVKKVRSLISLMESYAAKIEATGKAYAPLLSLGRNHSVHPHKPFSRQKINRLWNALDTPGTDTVLILLYTGMRVGEPVALAPVIRNCTLLRVVCPSFQITQAAVVSAALPHKFATQMRTPLGNAIGKEAVR
ncbi:hypothetical protein [Acidaminococcus sp.]|uniref:hypothetical protein n=1 Tax=Acidaminococcus sp. TaxID=1872103 RepID=UPI003522FF1B